MKRRREWVTRRRWLNRLADIYERDPDGFAFALWTALYYSLRDARKHWRVAERIALRQAQLVVILLDGHQQKTAARSLGICERQAKYDVAHVRRVLATGALDKPQLRRRIDGTLRAEPRRWPR